MSASGPSGPLVMYARPIPVQTKAHFKYLQFLAVTYDMGFLSCAL